MRKFLFIVMLLVIVSIAVSSLTKTSSDTGYANFLPENALITFSLNSPAQLVEKFPKDDFPEVFKNISAQSKSTLGDDILNADFYMQNGIDPRKPFGFSLLDFDKGKITAVVFFGVHDQDSFFSFVKEKAIQMGIATKFIDKSIGSMDCLLFDKQPQSAFQGMPKPKKVEKAILAVKDGYGIIYTASVNFDNQNEIEEKFLKDIASNENRLASNSSFVISLQEMGNLGDLFYYMDYAKMMTLYSQILPPNQKQMMEKAMVLQKDLVGFSGALSIEDNELKLTGYAQYGEDSEMLSMYHSDGSCEELGNIFPKMPLAFLTLNLEFSKLLPLCKNIINSLIVAFPSEPKIQNADELINTANEAIRKKLEIIVDIEKDILANIKGNGLFALYDLPANVETFDSDVVFGFELVNARAFKATIIRLIDAVEEKSEGSLHFSRVTSDIDTFSWLIDADKMGFSKATKISPTIAFYKNYLLFASKNQTILNITNGNYSGNSLLSNLDNALLKAELENKGIVQLSIKLGEFLSQSADLVPDENTKKSLKLAKNFEEIYCTNQIRREGLYGNLAIRTEKNFIVTVAEIVGKIKKVLQAK